MLASSGGITAPTDISGCVLWLRGDLGVTLTSSKVSTWANQGTAGSAGDATQTSAGLRPTQSSGGLNGQTRIAFDATVALEWPYDVNGASTTLVVVKLGSAPGTGFTIYALKDTSVPAKSAEMIADLNTYQPVSFTDDWTTTTGMVGIADSLGTSVGHAILHTFDGISSGLTSSYAANLDGTGKTVVSSGAYGGVGASGRIGARAAGTFALNGDLYEIVRYSRVLSGAEQTLLVSYATARYAL